MPQCPTRLPAGPELARELEHVLALGIVGGLRDQLPGERPECAFAVVEDEGGAPAAAALRTAPRNAVLSVGPPQAIVALAEHIADGLADLPGVIGPAASVAWFADRWRESTGDALRPAMALRAYACAEPTPVPGVAGRARPAVEGDRDVLAAFVEAFAAEALDESLDGQEWAQGQLARGDEGGPFVWEDAGEVVAMASVVRPTPSTLTINNVYTPPAKRKRGYAGALTAACTQWIRVEHGRSHACLFTDLANPASNRAYTRVGFAPVGDYLDARSEAVA